MLFCYYQRHSSQLTRECMVTGCWYQLYVSNQMYQTYQMYQMHQIKCMYQIKEAKMKEWG